MGISISGSNAISGLGGNDTDFDKVLENLKKIESTQLNKLQSWKSDWKLRYDAFTEIINQIQAASSMLSQLSDKNAFVTKNVTSSNENIITAVANASAQDIQHTINVKQTASNAIWANTAHIYAAKDEIINTSGATQQFKGVYAGKEFSFDIPAKTNLESFQNMINNSADNPGIRVSLLQTGNGYLLQVSGKDTGVANDLQIYDSDLVGFQAAGSTNTWTTNNTIKHQEQLTNPTSFTFDVVLNSGARKTLELKGDATAKELVDKLNNLGGVTASLDASGNLKLEGVQSFTRRKDGDEAYKAASTTVGMTGDLADAINKGMTGLPDATQLKFTLTMDDGTTRTFAMAANSSKRDVYAALAQAAGMGTSLSIDNSGGGNWSATIAGVQNIAIADATSGADWTSLITKSTTAASGIKDNLNSASVTANTTLTFDAAKLSDRLDGKSAGDPATNLTYTIVDQDGNAHNLVVSSDTTNQTLIDYLTGAQTPPSPPATGAPFDPPLPAGSSIAIGTPDASGNTVLDLTGIKEFRLLNGADAAAYTASAKYTTTIGARPDATAPTDGDLFYRAAGATFADTNTLEEAPDLVYTVRTNDGKVGILTMPSGTKMEDVATAFGTTSDSHWLWVDAATYDAYKADPAANPLPGTNNVTAPTLGVTYTDKDGKEYKNADGSPMTLSDIGDQPVYLNFKNIQSVSGPGITGQVSASSNWNIQRAANAIYTVDNWPVEMESTTNTISDSIEGVVVSIQEVGEARISVSTDITSVEQSIQNFLDAVNSVLVTVNNLMKYDESKEVTSNDPEDIGNENYSPSGLTNQKGNLLTGNYGVQLFKSRFSNCITSTPPGFQSRQTADDVLSGDLLATLANLGIKTDTDTTSDTYGLLVLAPTSGIAAMQELDKENYNDMITNHLEAVVDFFCTSGTGSSTTTDFRYASHVAGITKAGAYDVTYDVAADGTISNVKVGGQEAVRDGDMPGNYYTVAGGDPGGLAILIDDLTPGSHSGQVRIKEGLVQTVNRFLKDELVFNDVNISANSTPAQIADAVYLKSQNGALMSLRDNYMKVMESIDAKIEREQRRIDTWYNRQKQVFANLETLLKQYGEQQKSLEGQLKQLGGNG